MKKHESFYKISRNLQVIYKILEEMIYTHVKLRNKLTNNR